jgi:excisionase family DNA binding protein
MKHKPLFAPNDYRKLISITELEELTGIKRTRLRTWVRANKIPGALHSGRGHRWLFRREALEEWWRSINVD